MVWTQSVLEVVENNQAYVLSSNIDEKECETENGHGNSVGILGPCTHRNFDGNNKVQK